MFPKLSALSKYFDSVFTLASSEFSVVKIKSADVFSESFEAIFVEALNPLFDEL